MKNNMSETEYYKSGDHTKNILAAREKAMAKQQENKQARIDEYNLNPNTCAHCNNPLDYSKKRNKFCSQSCSASFNNRINAKSEETKTKISQSLTEYYKTDEYKNSNRNCTTKFCKVTWNICKSCNRNFYTRGWSDYYQRVTCGKRECVTDASIGVRTYTNRRRKNFYYYNKHEDRTVLLESSWENDIAIWLDSLNIVWIRPKFIKWFNPETSKMHNYYPDFFLPDLNMYLDPKNPAVMQESELKMSIVSTLIPILYGDKEYIKSEILKLL